MTGGTGTVVSGDVTTFDELSMRSGLAPKLIRNLLGELVLDGGAPWDGFRELVRRFRLRLSVLLLSNPDLAVAEVARRVGYSGTEAFCHALTAEGLPSPREIRASLLASRAEFADR